MRATRAAETALYATTDDASEAHRPRSTFAIAFVAASKTSSVLREARADIGSMKLEEASIPSCVTVWRLCPLAVACTLGTNSVLDVASASTSDRGSFVEARRLSKSYPASVFVFARASARASRLVSRSRPRRPIFKRSSPTWSGELSAVQSTMGLAASSTLKSSRRKVGLLSVGWARRTLQRCTRTQVVIARRRGPSHGQR